MGNCCLLRAPALTSEICDELFHFEENPDKLPTAMQANYCLTEDCKTDNLLLTNLAAENHTNYIFDASFETDVPRDFGTWLKQRRRWTNGDFNGSFINMEPKKIYNMMSHGFWRSIAAVDYQYNNIARILRYCETSIIPLETTYLMCGTELFLVMLFCMQFIWLASMILPM